jgi:hypothetical protein
MAPQIHGCIVRMKCVQAQDEDIWIFMSNAGVDNECHPKVNSSNISFKMGMVLHDSICRTYGQGSLIVMSGLPACVLPSRVELGPWRLWSCQVTVFFKSNLIQCSHSARDVINRICYCCTWKLSVNIICHVTKSRCLLFPSVREVVVTKTSALVLFCSAVRNKHAVVACSSL